MRTLFKVFIAGVMSTLLLTGCGGSGDGEPDEGGSGASSGEWFISEYAKPSDFREVNKAIDNHELLSSVYYKHYAEPDAFFEDQGCYSTAEAYWGRLRFIPSNTFPEAYHIVDDSTIEYYRLALFQIDARVGPNFVVIDAGNLGILSYTTDEAPIYHTYVEYDGKYVLDNGKILIRRGDNLIRSGGSTTYTKFTPEF